MPICLPSLDMADTKVVAKATGVGLQRDKNKCLTNSDGPEAFQKCASEWRNPEEVIGNKFDPKTASSEKGMRLTPGKKPSIRYRCNTDDPPPSKFDPLCVQF